VLAVALPEVAGDSGVGAPVEGNLLGVILGQAPYPKISPAAVARDIGQAGSVRRDSRAGLVVVGEENPARKNGCGKARATGARQRKDGSREEKPAHVCFGSKAFLRPSPTKLRRVRVEKS